MAYNTPAEAPQTSLANPEDCPPVTVQFLRWLAWKNTAYQNGQYAGFSEQEAAQLVKIGAARYAF